MKILAIRKFTGLLLWTFTVLSLENVLASPGFGYTLTMPLSSVGMYDDRAKRSLATICVEIKPNGPLEEPYYMCKGADFPQFPKISGLGNTATTNYGSVTGTSDISVKHNAANFAQNNYNEAPFSTGVSAANGKHVYGYSNEFSAGSNAGQSGHSQLETQTSLHQQNKQSSSTDVGSSQLQSQFNAGGTTKTFHEQASAGSIYQKPTERLQQHFTAEYQQQFQPISHKQQQQQHYQSQNQHKHSIIQPGTSFQSAFQTREQFFRPGTKSESNASTEKHNAYDSIYSDGGNGAASKQNGGFIPPATYGAQHTAHFGAQPAAPTFQSTATAAGSDGSALAIHTNQRFESSQYALHGTADCGEDCGKSVTQAAPSSGATQDGASQYAAKSTIHSTGYDAQSTKSFVAGGVTSQHGHVHSSSPASISMGDDQSSPSVPSTNYPPAIDARTSNTSPFRYGGNAAAAIATADGSSVPNLGPNDTRSLGSAFLRPVSNTAHSTSSSDALFGARHSQATHRQSVEAQQQNRHLHAFRHQSQQTPTQNIPSAQRYRSMIGDEVLQMPNWDFSTDELDLYRSVSSEDEDRKFELSRTPLLAPAPAPARTIPLEYLEDPVLRTFYSSFDDFGPLPTFSPAYPPNPIQPHAAYARQPLRRISYQLPQQSCSYPPAPQYYNYNPCPPQREYTFQPVFIALPCYGQSIYQTLGSPAPASVTGKPTTHLLPKTQTELQTPQPLPQSNVYRSSTNFAAKKSESAAITGSTYNVQKDVLPKVIPSTTEATTTKDDSNESSESVEDSTPTVAKLIQPKTKTDADTGSAELKLTSSENPAIVKFDTNLQDALKTTTVSPSLTVEKVGASVSAITPLSVDVIGGEMDSEMSTTFKSLILTARKLASMVTTSQEEEDTMYKDEISTPQPAPKKVRHVSRSSSNGKGNGGNKRRYNQQPQFE